MDTQATSATIRERLSIMDADMAKYQNNVICFNEYVVEQVDTLASRGETFSDVLINLFKGYSVCSDAEFCRYIAENGLGMMRVNPILCSN